MTASEVQQVIERINRMAKENSKRFTRLETILVGDDGDNGVKTKLGTVVERLNNHLKAHSTFWVIAGVFVAALTLVFRVLGV